MIKKFNEFINESKLNSIPQEGDEVKGVDGEQYTVIDFCRITDTSAVRSLLSKYDSSGAMTPEVDGGDLPRNTILVALEDSTGCTSVWQWDNKWLKNK